MEHEARSPARFSSLLSVEPHNQKPSAVRFAHGETKVPNLFQDLTQTTYSHGRSNLRWQRLSSAKDSLKMKPPKFSVGSSSGLARQWAQIIAPPTGQSQKRTSSQKWERFWRKQMNPLTGSNS